MGITKKEEEHTPSSCKICIPANIFRGTQLRSMGCVEHRRRVHMHNCGVCEICSGPIKRGYFLTTIKIKKHLEGISHNSKLPTNFVTWLSNNFQIN